MARISADNISQIIREGENDQVEFKCGTLRPNILARCIAAFANAKGGVIIIGYHESENKLLNYSHNDRRIINRTLLQLENCPHVECYEVLYQGHRLLIIEVQPNKDDFTYVDGAIYYRQGSQNRLMTASDIKEAYANRFDKSHSPYIAIEKMNAKNVELQNQIHELEEKLDKFHLWAQSADRSSFRWAIIFCVVGSLLGAILGTLLGKLFP